MSGQFRSVTLKRKNVIHGNCYTTLDEENKTTKMEEKNNSSSQDEKQGYRVTLDDKNSQQITKTDYNPEVTLGLHWVTHGYTSTDSEKDFSVPELLRKALKKFAWDEYNGVVENIPRSCKIF